ncbi:MAG: polyprenyl synthetase family protein [Caldilinea sp.]|nr:polyprenyl synthetase family protein [Caldilinea sp.]MDW8442637.1 polyprenyl synthetase family protein [Caldilineaceae bacterium]
MLISQLTSPQSIPDMAMEPSASYEAVETISQRNNASPDVNALFAPIRPGLRQVEAKLRAVDSTLFAPLAEAFLTLIGSGGKRLRPALALLSAEFNGPMQGGPRHHVVIALAASVEMLHTATLVHDDVIDGALLRRGAPTLNARWSGVSTVLAGNYLFGTAAHFSAETGDMRVIRLFSDTLRTIVDGELRQLKDRYNFLQPRENYYQRIYAKTASLFCAATQGAAILSRLPEERIDDLRQFGYNFGMAFQIIDDILDFIGDNTTLGKPAGSDLHQGTLTLPFFHYLQQHSAPESVLAMLEESQREADNGNPMVWEETVASLVHELRNSAAIEAAREEARRFLNRAVDNLSALPDNVYRSSLLGLCEFVEKRTY